MALFFIPPRFERWLRERRQKEKAHVKKVARVAAYFGVVGVLSAAYLAHNARAEVGEQMLRVGDNLSHLTDMLQETSNLSMNGQHVFMSSGIINQSVDKVLDRFEDHCKTGQGVFSNLLDEADPKELGDMNPAFKMGIVREKKGSKGALMCLVRGSETPETALEALQKFNDTRDFGALGDVRYVHVHKVKNGASKVTLLWTEGSVNLNEFMAEGGNDPTGRDPDYLPRPLNSQRLISIDSIGTKYNAFVYTSRESPEAVMADIKTKMDEKGWVTVGTTTEGVLARGFLKDDITAYVGIQRDEENGNTIVGMSEIEPGAGEQRDRSALLR